MCTETVEIDTLLSEFQAVAQQLDEVLRDLERVLYNPVDTALSERGVRCKAARARPRIPKMAEA